MVRSKEQIFFTAFIGLVILGAILVAKDWPLRASIIILLLGAVGAILVAVQLASDIIAIRAKEARITRPTFEVQAVLHHGRWGNLEIWLWLWALFFVIHLIGFPIALPLFVFLYVKLYGGGWVASVLLTGLTWAFLYGIYDHLLSVPWPKPWIASLLG